MKEFLYFCLNPSATHLSLRKHFISWRKFWVCGIQIPLAMLSIRANEIQNARKKQKYFWSIKTFWGRKKKVVYLMKTQINIDQCDCRNFLEVIFSISMKKIWNTLLKLKNILEKLLWILCPLLSPSYTQVSKWSLITCVKSLLDSSLPQM